MLENAMVAGFTAAGLDAFVLGPIPTPAVAMLTRSLRADIGVMISASHNPYEDNGIKLFGPDGYKLSDEIEQRIEGMLDKDIELALASHPDVAGVAVAAVPDPRLGEAVGAWLVLRPGVPWQGPDALVAHLEDARVAKQKIPTHWQIVTEIPRSITGKIQKHKLPARSDLASGKD